MRFFASQVVQRTPEKDYYRILGIQATSTTEQIKDAYRQLAKKYHPDVQTGAGADHQPDVEKFRDVLEAYQVLSVKESRAAFDLSRRKNPQQFEEMTEEQFNMNHRRDLRNRDGNVSRTPVARGSYAEQRIAELKRERAKYNVNDLGYYNGGVPRKHRGTLRGESLGEPGTFHSPQMHNFINFNHADSYRVTQEDAVKFKHFMNSDKVDFLRTKPAHPMFYDRDFDYAKDRAFWLRMLIGMGVVTYAFNKYKVEVDRARRTARMEGYKDMPAHWFHNRGGVVILKEFTGFRKYFKNGDEMMEWYYQVYPSKMAKDE